MSVPEDKAESARLEALKNEDVEIAYPGLTTETVEIVESVEQAPAIEWISLPIGSIPSMVARYVQAVEDNPKGYCSCLWIDKEHPTRGIVPTRVDEDETCIMHSRRGLVQGFFSWVINDGK